MVYFYTFNLFFSLRCYHYWFAFQVNNNGPFIPTEKHKLQLTHWLLKQSQETKYQVFCFSEKLGICFILFFCCLLYKKWETECPTFSNSLSNRLSKMYIFSEKAVTVHGNLVILKCLTLFPKHSPRCIFQPVFSVNIF